MICRRCGNENSDNISNCVRCGELLRGKFINVVNDDINTSSSPQQKAVLPNETGVIQNTVDNKFINIINDDINISSSPQPKPVLPNETGAIQNTVDNKFINITNDDINMSSSPQQKAVLPNETGTIQNTVDNKFINITNDDINTSSSPQQKAVLPNETGVIQNTVDNKFDNNLNNNVVNYSNYSNENANTQYYNYQKNDNNLQGNQENNNYETKPKYLRNILIGVVVALFIVGFVFLFSILFKNDNSISFVSPDLLMSVNETQQLNLSNNNVDVNYKSSNEQVATVSSDGFVTAVSPGKVYITAYNDDFEITIEIIIDSVIESNDNISFEQSKVSIKEGETYQLVLTGISDIQDVIYEVENSDIVSVTETGIVTGKKKGITNVNAIVGDLKTSIEVEVLVKYAVKLEIGSNNFETLECVTSSDSCEIILSNESINDDKILGWSVKQNDLTPKYKKGQSISIKENITLYAVVEKDDDDGLININEYKFPKVSSVATRKKKVLVIEIDPYLDSKDKKVSEFLEQSNNVETMLSNLKDDISYGSNNSVKVEIVGREYLNEFPTYKQQVTLLDGSQSYRFDEETYLSVFNNGWSGWWETTNSDFKKMDSDKLFDYDYILDKFDLVKRRNNNEFDEVWLISIDPASTYETAMVGRTAYWINGEGFIKDCDNFVIAGFTISRVDSPLECLGHGAENILSAVFGTELSYNKDNMNVTKANYDNLNLWQKFTLVDYLNSTNLSNLAGVGAIHFAPNSTIDYDWLNETQVKSNWIDWKNNYPNLTGETTLVNYETWNSTKDEYYAGRYFHRWWFSLMPHVSGYTFDGYSNNWWDYLYTLDYVKSVSSSKSTYTYRVGDKINNISISSKYQSGKNKTETLKYYQPNMIFSNPSILKVNSDAEIIASSKGTTTLKYYRDGKYITVNIEIE